MKKRALQAIIALSLAVAAGAGYGFLFVGAGLSIPCPFYKITGFYCPGCGVSRMCLSLLKGELYAAFRYNPLLFCLLPFFLVYGALHLIVYIRGGRWRISRLESAISKALVVLCVLYAIARNLPWFSFLAPSA